MKDDDEEIKIKEPVTATPMVMSQQWVDLYAKAMKDQMVKNGVMIMMIEKKMKKQMVTLEAEELTVPEQ